MESMSNVPYYLEKARSGYRMGDGKIVDGMIFDGLWDPYSQRPHGNVRRQVRGRVQVLARAQDEYAKESFRRALAAQKEGSSTPRSSP
jgi:acetyl-CoA C-acetyltransferase